MIKDIIKKNTFIMYLYKFLKGIKDKELRNRIICLDSDPNICEIIHNGEENRGIPIYYIEEGSSTIGFFALLRIVLIYIAYADYYGMAPYVKYKDCLSYHEENPINGSMNTFEYYFKLKNCIQNIENSAFIIPCKLAHFYAALSLFGLKKTNDYLMTDEIYDFYAKLVRKYLEINPIVLKKIEEDIYSLKLPEEYIAIHYRGTDFKQNYNNHPKSIEVEDFIISIKQLVDKQKKTIFLATDDEEALKVFVEEFKENIIFYKDTIRVNGTLSVICSKSNRDKHNYLMGYEVLRDMYTLSKANILVSQLSQVSIFAEIFKRSRFETFNKHIVISKGINHNSKSHVPDIMRAKKSN